MVQTHHRADHQAHQLNKDNCHITRSQESRRACPQTAKREEEDRHTNVKAEEAKRHTNVKVEHNHAKKK
jgi:hypothetical protein